MALVVSPAEHRRLLAGVDARDADELLTWSLPSADGVAVAYTKLAHGVRQRIPRDLSPTEPFNGVLDGDAFLDLLLRRWSAFAADEAQRAGFVILECALIQNPVTELLLFAAWQEPAIAAAVAALLDSVTALDPRLVLLRTPDVAATVAAVTAVRSDGEWREAAEAFVADSPFGSARGWALLDYLRWRTAFTDRRCPGCRGE